MNDIEAIELLARYCISIGVDGEGIRYIWKDIADKIEAIAKGEK